MRTLPLRAIVGVCFLTSFLSAAPKGNGGPLYERIVCVVPLVGTGTLDDPKRPLFVPVTGAAVSLDGSASKSKGFLDPATIVSYQSVPTDDGLQAVVLLVARDRAAFGPILGNNAGIKVFDLRNTSSDTLLKELRKVKQNFDLTALWGGAL